jgi:hypothetical protein
MLFGRPSCEKVAPAGQLEAAGRVGVPCLHDGSAEHSLYQDLLSGSYDCVDRIVLNAYLRMGHDPGGFRVWWRTLTGSDETLENTYLMRMAGRFSRRLRGYAKAHGIPVIDCSAGQRKHDLAEEYLAKTTVPRACFSCWLVEPRHQCGMSTQSTTSNAKSRCPQPSLGQALRQPLFVPHSRLARGPSDDQDQRASAVPPR